MAIIGYMRVSTPQQKFDSQERALHQYGVDVIYKEHISGLSADREELDRALASLKPGDTFVIFKLDRLARKTKQLLILMEQFKQQDIQFVSIQNNIDTTTAMGRFFFTVMGAFSEMETEIIRERVKAGLEAAKDKGTPLGRPTMGKKGEQAIKLYQSSELSVSEIANQCEISVPTVYNYLKQHNIPKKQPHQRRQKAR